jgi:dTDP-4-dehydrorhamnose reductase
VIGASGFLGARLLALAPRDTELVGTGNRRPVRPGRWREARLDVTSPSQITALLERERPDSVLYCCYETSSRAVTADGARDAARAAARAGAAFVFVSSDLVFDGSTGGYTELATARPVLTYGQYKLDAEGHVKVAHPEALIVRPSLLVGESGITIRPAWECGNLLRGQPVDLYADEWRTPVLADDVARAIWELVAKEVTGVYHLGGPARMSRLELGRLLCTIHRFNPALIREAKRPPERPKDVSLNSARAAALLGWASRPIARVAELPLAAAGV